MQRTKIAIACQGGGSQTAFTAGALKGLIEAREASAREFLSRRATVVAAASGEARRTASAALKCFMWRGALSQHGDNREGEHSKGRPRRDKLAQA
jgi:hypothetical protein